MTFDRKNTPFKKHTKMNRKDKNLTEYTLVTDIPRSLNEQRISKMNKVIPKLKDNVLDHPGTMIKVRVT